MYSENNNKVEGMKAKERLCGSTVRPKGVLERRKEMKIIEHNQTFFFFF